MDDDIKNGADPYAPEDVANELRITLLKDGRLVTAMPANTLLCYELLIAALHIAQENGRKVQQGQRESAIIPPNGPLLGKVRMPR